MTAQLKLSSFDQIECWGQPWHGVMTLDGSMTMDAGGVVKTGGVALTGGQAQLVQFAGLPTPTTEAYETALGMAWKNWAILAGNKRQYTPFADFVFDAQSWLYRCTDGTVYKLQLFADDNISPVQIRAIKVGVDSGGIPTVLWTGLASYANDLNHYTTSQTTCVSASGDGSKAVVVVSVADRGLALSGSYFISNSILPPTVPAVAYEITVSGGSVSTIPSVSVSLMSADNIDARGNHTSYAAQTVTDHVKSLISAWMKPNGTVQKTYLEIEISREFVAGSLGPGSTGAVSSMVVDAYIVTNEGRLLINHMDATFTLTYSHTDGNGPVYGMGAATVNQSPIASGGSASTVVDVGFRPNTDYSVLGIYSNAVPKMVGALGSVRDDVVTADLIKILCQHPITGALFVDKHVF